MYGQSFSEGNARAGMRVRAALHNLALIVSLRVSDSTQLIIDTLNCDLADGLLATSEFTGVRISLVLRGLDHLRCGC